MKANEAPERVYIHKSQYWGLMVNEHNITKNGVEYIRTDAFIEKACNYLMEYEFNDSPTIVDRRKRVDEFINYMENKA